jgi:hypothetical protein
MGKRGKIFYSRTGHRSQHGACALHTGYLRPQTHSEYVILIAFTLQQWLHVFYVIRKFRVFVTKPVPIMHKEQLKINKINADPCGHAV